MLEKKEGAAGLKDMKKGELVPRSSLHDTWRVLAARPPL